MDMIHVHLRNGERNILNLAMDQRDLVLEAIGLDYLLRLSNCFLKSLSHSTLAT